MADVTYIDEILDDVKDAIEVGLEMWSKEANMRIWMPRYLNHFIIRKLNNEGKWGQYTNTNSYYMNTLFGVRIIEGYRNVIIVGYREAALRGVESYTIIKIP